VDFIYVQNGDLLPQLLLQHQLVGKCIYQQWGVHVYRCHNYYLGIIINLMFDTKHEHDNTFPRSRARLRFRGGT
jgi:hypothetical protein